MGKSKDLPPLKEVARYTTIRLATIAVIIELLLQLKVSL